MFILIHGASASSLEMERIGKLLNPPFESRAINLLGHGGRSIPEKFLLGEMSDDLIGSIEEAPAGRTICSATASAASWRWKWRGGGRTW
jgi:hypothetical protein